MKKASLIIAVVLLALLLMGCDSKEESAVKAVVNRRFDMPTRALSISKYESDHYRFIVDVYDNEQWVKVVGHVYLERGTWQMKYFQITGYY